MERNKRALYQNALWGQITSAKLFINNDNKNNNK